MHWPTRDSASLFAPPPKGWAGRRTAPPRCAQVGDGVFEVLSTSGDTHLGGDDFDRRIVDYLADDFQRGEGIDLRKDRQALQRLTEAAEKAKMELSTLSQARAGPGLQGF